MMLLNLGSGTQKIQGFVNLDIDSELNPDIIHDVEKPLPFESYTFDGGLCSHLLEHVRNLPQLQKEIWRITKPAGVWEIRVPFYLSPDAWGDPTHIRAFSHESFTSGFWLGWKITSLDIKESTKIFTQAKVQHLHVTTVRMLEYKQYVPDDFFEYWKQVVGNAESTFDNSKMELVSDGEEKLEQYLVALQRGEVKQEGVDNGTA